jgi:hypothetical protein
MSPMLLSTGIPVWGIVVATSRHQICVGPLRSSSQATVEPEITGAVWFPAASVTVKGWGGLVARLVPKILMSGPGQAWQTTRLPEIAGRHSL